jgi:hypothetical protein
LSQLNFIDKLIADNHQTNDVIQRLAMAAEGVPLEVLADALMQYSNAVYAEINRIESVKYLTADKVRREAEQVFSA